VVSAADLENCAARDIFTVQQLAQLKGDKLPPAIRELAERARAMIKLQGQTGKYEAIISGLTAERDQLAEQLKEAHQQLSARDAMIDTLKMKVA
jgi:cell division protein FtsB